MSWLTRVFRRDAAPPAALQRAFNTDNWANIVTGLLTARDKRTYGQITVDIVTDVEARDMWRGDDIAKRVIEVLPREAMRRGYELKTDDKETAEMLVANADEVGIDQAVVKAAQYERAYGGAAVFPVMDGALGDLSTPLTTTGIGRIRAIHILEPRELYPFRWYSDIRHPKFGRPEVYRCIPLFSGGVMSSPLLYIHESRLGILPGIRTTRLPQPGTLLGWGDNNLTCMRTVLSDYGQSWGTVASLLQDFSQGILSMDGMDQKVATKKGAQLKARLQEMDFVRHAMRMIIIDAKDKFERVQTPLTNLSDIMDRFATRLAAAADMPITLLMGMSPAGLNATGESDRAFLYDRVSALQHYLTPLVEWLHRLNMIAIEGPTEGVEPEVWSVEWKPLWSPSDKEKADTELAYMQAYTAAVNAQILTPEEVRTRWRGDGTGSIVLDDKAWEEQNSMDVDVSDLTPEEQLALGVGNANPEDIANGEAPNDENGISGARPVKQRGRGAPPPKAGRRVQVKQHERTVRGTGNATPQGG
jgi:phage-related protein (TIGR01555 family)